MKDLKEPRTESQWDRPFLHVPIPMPPPWWINKDDSRGSDSASDDTAPRVIIIDITGEEEV